MKILGITGGIGSGKSLICRILSTQGIPVYSADDAAKRLMSSPAVSAKIRHLFGDEAYTADGVLNRQFIADRVFSDTEKRQSLNAIIHPAVHQDCRTWISSQRQKNIPLAAIESALPSESHFGEIADYVICVSAPLELRIARVMCRNALSREQVLARIHAQRDDSFYAAIAQYILLNDNKHAILKQLSSIISRL